MAFGFSLMTFLSEVLEIMYKLIALYIVFFFHMVLEEKFLTRYNNMIFHQVQFTPTNKNTGK